MNNVCTVKNITGRKWTWTVTAAAAAHHHHQDSHSSSCCSSSSSSDDEDNETAHPVAADPPSIISQEGAAQQQYLPTPPPCPPATNATNNVQEEQQQQQQQQGPATASAPVTSHFDALLECLDMLRLMEEDNDNITKQDVIDSMRSMLHNMLSTVMMHSFSTSMSVKGWRVE
jgi:hypothetical protein